MKRLTYAVLTLLLVLYLASAQTVYAQSTVQLPPVITPIDPTPFLTALAQQSSWTSWAQVSFSVLGQNQFNDEANITKLQSRLDAAEKAIAAIQKQLAPPSVPGNPAPTPIPINFVQTSGGTVAATTLPVTPALSLTFSTGNWNLGPQGLSPAADGQTFRNITFSTPVKLISVVYSGASIKITDTTLGSAVPNPNAPVTGGVPTGTQVILSTGWNNAVTNITIGGTGAASATTLQMQSFTIVLP